MLWKYHVNHMSFMYMTYSINAEMLLPSPP